MEPPLCKETILVENKTTSDIELGPQKNNMPTSCRMFINPNTRITKQFLQSSMERSDPRRQKQIESPSKLSHYTITVARLPIFLIQVSYAGRNINSWGAIEEPMRLHHEQYLFINNISNIVTRSIGQKNNCRCNKNMDITISSEKKSRKIHLFLLLQKGKRNLQAGPTDQLKCRYISRRNIIPTITSCKDMEQMSCSALVQTPVLFC